jgi:MFS family permease
MLNPVALSIVRNVFEDPRERAQAIGAWGAVFGLSVALGPIVGGALVVSVGWPAVFFVNIPIGILAIILTRAFVPESRAPRPRRLDPVGQILVIAALTTLTYAIIHAPTAGWTSAETVALFAIAAACLATLVRYELQREQPLIEVRFFRSAPFSGANAIAGLTFAAIGGFLFLNTLYLQTVRGLSPLAAGLYVLPMAAMLLVCALLSGRIVGRRGARLPMLLGACAMLIGALMLTRLAPHTPTGYLLVSYLLFGSGLGFINPPATHTALSGMPPAQAGVAAAIGSTSRQVGMTLGVAVIGAIAGSSLEAGIGPGFARATHSGWWIVAGLAVAIATVATVTTSRWAQATAHRTADRLRDQPAPRLAPIGSAELTGPPRA